MAGHSKWANIQHRKNAQDAKRGKVVTKVIREITVAARMGGGDSAANSRLRTAVDSALSVNMTRDTIDRAIKRGAGGDEGQNMEGIRYEGYGPGGVAVMVQCLTDNRNRTVSEVRHAFSKGGGHLGTDGSVAYLFSKIGQFIFEAGISEDKVMEAVLDAGADDILTESDGSIEVKTIPENFERVREALLAKKLTAAHSSITMQPATWIMLDLEAAQKLLKLVDSLENLDDVQEVYHNGEIPEEAYR